MFHTSPCPLGMFQSWFSFVYHNTCKIVELHKRHLKAILIVLKRIGFKIFTDKRNSENEIITLLADPRGALGARMPTSLGPNFFNCM